MLGSGRQNYVVSLDFKFEENDLFTKYLIKAFNAKSTWQMLGNTELTLLLANVKYLTHAACHSSLMLAAALEDIDII